jgi:serine/threonine protein kinase
MQEVIGVGGFGKVYRATHKQTGEEVAVKYMDITENCKHNPNPLVTHADQIEEIYREHEALEKLDHRNIVKLLKAFT